MTPRRSKRLTRDDWLAAGMEVLAAKGIEALKAEPLARHLRTTKGSFYWHFKDVGAFQEELLALWEEAALAAMTQTLDTESTPVGRLRALAQAISDPERRTDMAIPEPAVRAWAMGHATAQETVARVDTVRLSRLQALLSETGIDNPEMARIVYAAAIGMGELGESGNGDNIGSMGSLVDLILALR